MNLRLLRKLGDDSDVVTLTSLKKAGQRSRSRDEEDKRGVLLASILE